MLDPRIPPENAHFAELIDDGGGRRVHLCINDVEANQRPVALRDGGEFRRLRMRQFAKRHLINYRDLPGLASGLISSPAQNTNGVMR